MRTYIYSPLDKRYSPIISTICGPKNPRKTCPDNIVNTKFRETKANSCREDWCTLVEHQQTKKWVFCNILENMKSGQKFKNQRKTCPDYIVRKLHTTFQEGGVCGCRDMMYLSWLLARQKLSVFWKFEKKPNNEHFKNQRKMCTPNIVRKMHAKFCVPRANGCRDMMYLSK